MKTRPTRKSLIICLLVLGIGFFFGSRCSNRPATSPTQHSSKESAAAFWTCSMHPQIHQPGPGKCPICGMDLIPVTENGGDEELGPREIKLSARAEKLAEVATAPVERRFVTRDIRMVGKIAFDETLLSDVTAWVPGRLDRLYVDYTGISVKKGDHMVSLYSPDLLAAQEELIQAIQSVKAMSPGGASLIKDRSEQTIHTAREKLRLFGLTPEQIADIESSQKTEDHLTIYSPVSGTVIQKDAQEGMYVKTGTRIYTIADLSTVWVKLEAYESDLQWLHYGQAVSFEAQAYPGKSFEGRVAFIDPVLDAKTRTVKLRVNVPNPDEQLKPGMFVTAEVHATVAQGGNVAAPDLAGKWISPMHPEIIKNGPGSCDICGMDLVPAESIGYVPAHQQQAPLIIPASAPLFTGKRSVVYVSVPNRPGIYEGREVTLGPRAGNDYIVLDGLAEGELVVKRGAFKIDSAIQILAKPSMMNPEGSDIETDSHRLIGDPPSSRLGGTTGGQAVSHYQFTNSAASTGRARHVAESNMSPVIESYLEIQDALAGDLFEAAQQALQKLQIAVDENGQTILKEALTALLQATDIHTLRIAFAPLSDILIRITKTAGSGTDLYVLHCPMALEDGANWLQDDKETRNPYYGASMLKCGGVTETISRRE